MKKITLNNALDEAYVEEMRRDENVILLGEDVHTSCGATSHPILSVNLPERMLPMPITEQLICNSVIGMALGGMRPVAELGFEDFVSLGFDALANQAAKIRFWSHGKVCCPIVIVTTGGVGAGCGCNHSQKVEAWLANVPGLKILCPSTAADTKGMMKSAIRDDDPVLFLVNRSLQYIEDEIPEDEDYVVPLGKARIAREGTDLTVVCWHRPYVYTMELAEELAAEGISLEVIDMRSICPFDKNTIIESVRKTGRLLVTHEAPYKFGPCAEIITSVVEEAMDSLKAAPVRACTPMTAIPSLSPEMETVVTKQQIKDAIYKVMKG